MVAALSKLGPALLCVSLAALTALATSPPAAFAAGKPNIVVIQSDDQTYGQFTREVMPKTFKLLVDHGTSFNDYIVTTALCCPSRASLLTGQYAHNHGVLTNGLGGGGGYPALIDKGNVLPVWLREAGYNTIHVGKFLNSYGQAVSDPAEVAPGWDDWQTLISGEKSYYDYALSDNGHLVHKGTADRDYVTRVVTHRVVNAVREYAPSARPFYLEVDQRAPHVRGNRRGRCSGRTPNAEPDPRDIGEFRNAPLPGSPSFNEEHMGDKPPFMRGVLPLTYRDRKLTRRHWSCALASLVGVDRSVARIFRAIKATGEIHKTVFIYISDNGHFYGEHRLAFGKIFPYEEALHQPLVIRIPKRYRDGARRVRSVGKPVANIDLAPTMLDLAGGAPCPPTGACRTMDGRSLMPLLTRSGRWPAQRAILTEYQDHAEGRYAPCAFAGIRTRHGIYVEHYRVVDPATQNCEPTLQVERYDLEKDPYELRSLCYGGLPASCPPSERQAELERRLQSLRQCAGIRGRDDRVDGRPYCE